MHLKQDFLSTMLPVQNKIFASFNTATLFCMRTVIVIKSFKNRQIFRGLILNKYFYFHECISYFTEQLLIYNTSISITFTCTLEPIDALNKLLLTMYTHIHYAWYILVVIAYNMFEAGKHVCKTCKNLSRYEDRQLRWESS